MHPNALRYPNFSPMLPHLIATNDGGAVVTVSVAPTFIRTVTTMLDIRLPAVLFAALLEHGWTLFGNRAGHVVIARPDAPRRVERLHPVITGAPVTYRPLYRDGDPLHLMPSNLGFTTPKGGYDWWLVPGAGEHDPAWNVEGLTYRVPKAIAGKRGISPPAQPAYTPTLHRVPDFRLAEAAELARMVASYRQRRRLDIP